MNFKPRTATQETTQEKRERHVDLKRSNPTCQSGALQTIGRNADFIREQIRALPEREQRNTPVHRIFYPVFRLTRRKLPFAEAIQIVCCRTRFQCPKQLGRKFCLSVYLRDTEKSSGCIQKIARNLRVPCALVVTLQYLFQPNIAGNPDET